MSFLDKATSPQYRADIDGLRAIAVGLVVGYHAFPSIVPGGFVGVDVFFVISGFLITGLILGDIAKNKFSVPAFYARRIRRIFPALIVVLLATLVIGWMVMLPAEYKTTGLHVAGGAGYVSNIILWNESGYFDAEALRKPLLHLWSLGVEEQFYLVWPLLLVVGHRLGRLLPVLFVILVSSFILNCIQAASGQSDDAFYSPFTRIWELAAGAVALCIANSCFLKRAGIRSWCAWSGLALILAAALLLNSTAPYPGWRAAAPVGGTVLVILGGSRAWPNRALLSQSGAVWLGLISYPLYLWHWPLLVFAHIDGIEAANQQVIKLGIVAVSIGLAWLTYAAVEFPFRSRPATLRLSAILSGAMACIGVAGLVVYFQNGVPARFPEIIRSLGTATYTPDDIMREWRYKTCFIYPERDGGHFAPDCIAQSGGPLVYLWGDSHAAALYPGLKAVSERSGFDIGQFTTSACPPLINWNAPHRERCRDINRWNLANVEKLKPNILLLHADWLVDYYPLDRLADTLAALSAQAGTQVVVVGPAPHWYEPVANLIYREWSKGPRTSTPPLLVPMREPERTMRIEAELRAISKAHNAQYFSIIDTLCANDGCIARFGDRMSETASYDGAHLTPAASRYVVEAILAAVGKQPTREKDIR